MGGKVNSISVDPHRYEMLLDMEHLKKHAPIISWEDYLKYLRKVQGVHPGMFMAWHFLGFPRIS